VVVGQYDIHVIIGAFVISGTLIVLTGLISPLSKALASIPLSLGTLLMCFQTAFNYGVYRESALYTFLLTISGISLLGISSVVWGLMAGLLHIRLAKKN